MARVYIISNIGDREFDKGLSQLLAQKGHDIIDESSLLLSGESSSDIRRSVNSADVYILIVSNNLIDSTHFLNEAIQLRNYATHSNKLVLPIFLAGVQLDKLPSSITNIAGVTYEGKGDDEIYVLASRIDEAINLFLGKRLATEEKAQEIKEKIESSAPEYITETLAELTKRETYLRRMALLWYVLGFVTLLCGIGVAVWFANNGLADFKDRENWSKTLFYTIKSLFIIVLLIAASKYSFNLAKAYMNESLKISDRIHAISFGRFYLRIFNQRIEPSELKEIFRDWNISNQSGFTAQSSNEYDPKILESLAGIIDKIRNTGKQ